MQKKLVYGVLILGIVVALFVSCGAAPLGVVGDWNAKSGEYEWRPSSGDDEDGEIKSGSISIQKELFEVELVWDVEDKDSDYDYTLTITGNGQVAVNSKEKVISLFYDSYKESYDYDVADYDDYEREWEQDSESYFYELSGGTMTLTRNYEYVSPDDDKTSYDETLTLERK
jgi:hypothetical protein